MSYKIKYTKVAHDKWFTPNTNVQVGEYFLFPISYWTNKLILLYGEFQEWEYKSGLTKITGHPNVLIEVNREEYLLNTKLTLNELDFIEQLLQPIIDKYYISEAKENNMWVTDNYKVPIDADIETMIITLINNAKLR